MFGVQRGVDLVELLLSKQQIHAAESDERGDGDVEPFWRAQVRNERRVRVEIQVLRPGAIPIRVEGVIRRRNDVWVK